MIISKRHILLWLTASALFGALFIMWNLTAGITPSDGILSNVRRGYVDTGRDTSSANSDACGSNNYPTNSRAIITKKSLVYDAITDPSCWIPDCKKRSNHLAYRTPESGDINPMAVDWNVLGVISMERYLNGELVAPEGYNTKSLTDAIWYFSNATKECSEFAQAFLNLGIAKMMAADFGGASQAFSKAVDLFESSPKDQATAQLFWGLTEESAGNGDSAFNHYKKMRQIDATIEKLYWGIATTQEYRQDLTSYGSWETTDTMRAFGTFAYFSPVAISDYGLLKPGTQDWFLENRYIVLRKILHPFLIYHAARTYRSLITNGVLKLGDTQSKRYVAYNDRVTRFLHHRLTQLVRKITSTNAKPSYTYFGGYVGGAKLDAHTDREQCEWTMSLNFEHYPHNATWLLSLDKLPLFDRTLKHDRPSNVKPDDETRIADADLYAGDALLFMGRHLIHFRRGALPEGQWTNQGFLHYVPAEFGKTLN